MVKVGPFVCLRWLCVEKEEPTVRETLAGLTVSMFSSSSSSALVSSIT